MSPINQDRRNPRMRNRIVSLLASIAMVLGACAVAAEPAMANGACPSNNVCFYECTLASSCGYTAAGTFTLSGCNNMSYIETKSIKNNSGRKYVVYKGSDCTGAQSVIYPNSSGNMNSEWAGNVNGMMRTVI